MVVRVISHSHSVSTGWMMPILIFHPFERFLIFLQSSKPLETLGRILIALIARLKTGENERKETPTSMVEVLGRFIFNSQLLPQP